MEPQRLTELFLQTYGCQPKGVERLTAAGSNRQYFRLFSPDGTTCIGVIGTSAEENEAFYQLAICFHERHLPTPQVFAMSNDRICYLQEDLGSISLFDAIRRGRQSGGAYDASERELLRRTVSLLPRFQFEGAGEEVYQHCYPQRYFDATTIHFDLNYFKYDYLKLVGVEFNELRLEHDFNRLCDDLLSVSDVGFMYRDFQARNVMLLDQKPYFIDFQGGRRGPIYYDVASFLWQASARYPEDLKQELIDAYLAALKPYLTIHRDLFLHRLRLFVLFRTLQVLGAYGFRGLWEKKQHFIDSIPSALENLRSCIANGSCDDYPYLKEVIMQTIASQPAMHACQPEGNTDSLKGKSSPLVVRIYSFSYKKGIPADESGNGGGYVFDCRSTNNPGRYEAYKQLTGLDQPVIDFLEKDGEILRFLESVYRLADFHVQRYIERDFTSLMFSFGCTGGQHRSVYCAQHLAEHLHQRFGIAIQLCHREQGILQQFSPHTDEAM